MDRNFVQHADAKPIAQVSLAGGRLASQLLSERAIRRVRCALGRACSECGRLPEALAAYQQGLEAAQRNGDKQAAREMQVFSQRIEKALRAIGL